MDDWVEVSKEEITNLQALKEAGADVAAQDKKDGWTPMHCAAQNGHVDAIKALKEAGADVAAQDKKDGWTPMHFAAQNGHVDAIKALKEAGADVAEQDKHGSTPMHSKQIMDMSPPSKELDLTFQSRKNHL